MKKEIDSNKQKLLEKFEKLKTGKVKKKKNSNFYKNS